MSGDKSRDEKQRCPWVGENGLCLAYRCVCNELRRSDEQWVDHGTGKQRG
jgi:hypothetical protein